MNKFKKTLSSCPFQPQQSPPLVSPPLSQPIPPPANLYSYDYNIKDDNDEQPAALPFPLVDGSFLPRFPPRQKIQPSFFS
jgi:hypothetical protein